VSGEAQGARNGLVHAARVLSGLGLVTAFGHVSQRAGSSLLITPAADLACVHADDLIEVRLDAAELPSGAPAEAWAHLHGYAARPDVGAFAAAAALAGADQLERSAGPACLPLLHGQACWLGERVPVHDDARLLRSAALAAAAAATLGQSNALLLRGNGALTCGDTAGLAVTRMWLVAAACEAWLTAAATGVPRPLDAGEAESWRAVQGELLPRLWQHLSRTAATS
jgi:HCOMODA/2-hydroxy-3-carboxy-muconic semialdehyde decarboxylase